MISGVSQWNCWTVEHKYMKTHRATGVTRGLKKRFGRILRTKKRPVAKRPHDYLMQKSRSYARWHGWRWHSQVHALVAVVSLGGIAAIGIITASQVFAASSWTQSDWSGGVGTSATTQYASKSGINASASGMKLGVASGWLDENWTFRKNIVIDNSTVKLGVTSTDLVNFPLLVKLNSSRIDYSQIKSDGSDLRFTDPSAPGTTLAYQIDTWNTLGDSFVWVKVPKIDVNSSSDYITMYYGNPDAVDGQAPTSVWDANSTVEYHMSDVGGVTIADSTSNALNAAKTQVANPLATTDGKIGGAMVFDGLQYIVRPAVTSYNISRTIEFWFNSANINEGQRGIMTAGNTMAEGSPEWLLAQDASGRLTHYANGYTSGSTVITPGTWYYVAYTYDANTATQRVYLNNVNEIAVVRADSNTSNTNVYIGGGYAQAFKGMMDNVSISNSVARSASWLAAKYRNGNDQYTSFGTLENRYVTSGSLTSAIFDTGQLSTWKTLNYTSTGATITVKLRSSNSSTMVGAPDFSSCNVVASGDAIGTSTCITEGHRYVQYQVALSSSDGQSTPELTSISVNYDRFDPTPPTVNAMNLSLKNSPGGDDVAEGSWTGTMTPSISWMAGQDDVGGSGIKGYCLYLGQDDTADVVTTKGLFGTSPVNTGGACAYAVAGTSLNLVDPGVLDLPLATSNDKYYLLIKAIDNANNIFDGAPAVFNFKYDNTPPTVPGFVTAPSQFISTKQVTLTWPSSGPDMASDSNSGLRGLQYRIGNAGLWYGKDHVGSGLNDVLDNNGSYSTVSDPDFANLSDGNNIVSFRSIDNAGNVSSAYVTTVIKLNTSSPSSPRSVTAAPGTNSVNSFAFSWAEPASFTGSASNLTYCYTINALPTVSNCSYTAAGVRTLPAGPYATQPGENTFYIVAKDEAGNINLSTAGTTTFTANTSAPSLPLSLEIADVSNKATSTWKLALSWNQPADVGAGISTYKIARSSNGTTYAEIASSAGTSYVDNGLSNLTTYYYKVRACDSANNCGAYSSIVTKLPTGRFTTAPELVTQPSVTVSTRTAKLVWTTDRNSDSRVQYGVSTGQYLPTEAASSELGKSHAIELNNLSAGTTYYYKARWIDEDGNIGTSTELAFTTLPAPTIKDVKIVRTTLSSVTMQFTSSNSTSVKLFFGKGESFGGLKVVNTSRSESTYTVELDGLDDGTVYVYKLNPVDTDGNEYNSTQQSSFSTPQRPRIANLRFQPVKDKSTSTQMVTWTTNVPATSLVRFGAEGVSPIEVIDSKLVTEHELVVENLKDDTTYILSAQSRDADGNLAISDSTSFKTALDTRPPSVESTNVQTSIRGNGSEARGQIIVAWKTDEPSTSQVAYRTGRGKEYTSKTAEDSKLTTDHVVVISDLSPSNVYHLQALSKDKVGNQGMGSDKAAIIGRPTDNVMTIILNALQGAFGF